ncbi:hypothetical protein BDV24DRAFT_156669 [Aspergillus arachidicola]|uniref:Ribosomal RNA methyltransferase FtsJ domain-containing protein n=1 Tax=Aspergillus arachidicola TaxID=656916 RepID=A0A5N6XP03_9EURO|nr:hypothetical protein BDV24DRAFT_156669 [Aspergillus arachidicola]
MESSSKDPGSTVEDCRMAIKTQCLEKAYDNTLVHTAQLLNAEKNRLLRVEQLLLQFENENLRWQLNHVNQELTKTARVESEVRLQLQATYHELDQLRSMHRASSHEIETLRLELGSLTNASVDTKKLLAEKRHLSRVLSSAEADVERLKSQKTSQHTLLAEKRNLEQQVTSLEAQLESEKRAHGQTLARQSHSAEQIAALSSSLEEARNELMAEARARDGRERVFQQQSIEWAAQRAALDAKFDALNKKLRSTKDQYQAAATERRRHGTSNDHESKFSSAESTTQHNSGLTIATPGAIRAQDKISKTSTLPGQKSSFSITPFLNRTNGLQNSATSSEDDADELHATHMTSGVNEKASENDVQRGGNSRYQGQTASVDELPVAVDTLRLGHGISNSRKGGQTQRKLVDNSDPEGRMENISGIFTHSSNHGQPKSKKRKLGTQRDMGLFDEEKDDEDTHEIRRPGRKLVLGGTGRNFASQISAPSGGRLGRGRGLGGLGIDAKYRIFRNGQTVVDLVAVSRTGSSGRVLGVDIIPAQPPKGVFAIQGNFLDPSIQAYVQNFLHNPTRDQQHRPGISPHVSLSHEISELDEDTKNLIYNCEEMEEPCLTSKRTVDVVLSDMSAPWYQPSGFWK